MPPTPFSSLLFALPPELLHQILLYLPGTSLYSCMLTCTTIHSLVTGSAALKHTMAKHLYDVEDNSCYTRQGTQFKLSRSAPPASSASVSALPPPPPPPLPSSPDNKSTWPLAPAKTSHHLLTQLNRRSQRWLEFSPLFKKTIVVPHRASGIYDLTPGVYFIGQQSEVGAMGGVDSNCISAMRLPWAAEEGVEEALQEGKGTISGDGIIPPFGTEGRGEEPSKPLLWAENDKTWKQISFDARGIKDFGTALEEHDLIALIVSSPISSQPGSLMLEIVLLRYSTGKPHEDAKMPVIPVHEYSDTHGPPSVSIEIVGENLALAVIYAHTWEDADDVLVIYDWKTGVRKGPPIGINNTGAVFLSESLLVHPSRWFQSLDIYEIPYSEEDREVGLLCRLLLPTPTENWTYSTFGCRGEPNPSAASRDGWTADALYKKDEKAEGMKTEGEASQEGESNCAPQETPTKGGYADPNRPFTSRAESSLIIFNVEISPRTVQAGRNMSFDFVVHRDKLRQAVFRELEAMVERETVRQETKAMGGDDGEEIILEVTDANADVEEDDGKGKGKEKEKTWATDTASTELFADPITFRQMLESLQSQEARPDDFVINPPLLGHPTWDRPLTGPEVDQLPMCTILLTDEQIQQAINVAEEAQDEVEEPALQQLQEEESSSSSSESESPSSVDGDGGRTNGWKDTANGLSKRVDSDEENIWRLADAVGSQHQRPEVIERVAESPNGYNSTPASPGLSGPPSDSQGSLIVSDDDDDDDGGDDDDNDNDSQGNTSVIPDLQSVQGDYASSSSQSLLASSQISMSAASSFHTISSFLDTHSSGHSSSSSTSSRTRYRNVPWLEWGPSITRWFNSTSFARDYITTTSGHRYVKILEDAGGRIIPLTVVNENDQADGDAERPAAGAETQAGTGGGAIQIGIQGFNSNRDRAGARGASDANANADDDDDDGGRMVKSPIWLLNFNEREYKAAEIQLQKAQEERERQRLEKGKQKEGAVVDGEEEESTAAPPPHRRRGPLGLINQANFPSRRTTAPSSSFLLRPPHESAPYYDLCSWVTPRFIDHRESTTYLIPGTDMSSFDPEGVFSAADFPVGLPFLQTVTKRRYAYDAVIMDEQRIIGLKVSPDLNQVEELDVLFFG